MRTCVYFKRDEWPNLKIYWTNLFLLCVWNCSQLFAWISHWYRIDILLILYWFCVVARGLLEYLFIYLLLDFVYVITNQSGRRVRILLADDYLAPVRSKCTLTKRMVHFSHETIVCYFRTCVFLIGSALSFYHIKRVVESDFYHQWPQTVLLN